MKINTAKKVLDIKHACELYAKTLYLKASIESLSKKHLRAPDLIQQLATILKPYQGGTLST